MTTETAVTDLLFGASLVFLGFLALVLALQPEGVASATQAERDLTGSGSDVLLFAAPSTNGPGMIDVD